MNASFSRRQLLLAMLATPLVLSACGDKAPKQPAFRNLEGVDMSSADFAKDFSLLDTEGQRRTMADYRGKIVLIFFGFTQCPDVCPTALAKTASDFKVFYQKVPTGSSYTMDHSALTYVYDTQGKLQIALRHTQTAEEAVADIRQVLALSK
jgi:protein SCO1/2